MKAAAALWPRWMSQVVPLAALTTLCAASLGMLMIAVLGPVMPESEGGVVQASDQGEPSIELAESAPFVADALVAKPLFSPTRTPPAPPQAPPAEVPVAFVPPPAPEEPPPEYSVRGIIATPLTRKVLLRKEGQAKPIWLAEGEQSPEGWMLLRVSPTNAVLSKGSREMSVQIKPKRALKSLLAIR